MRILLATRIFSPEPAAASFRLTALAQALHDHGADVTVLTTTFPGDAPSVIDSKIDVRRLPVLRDRAGYVRGYLHYLSFDVPLLFRLLVVRRPDVVVVEPPPTTGAVVRLVCAIRRIPYVYYAADIWSDAAANAAPALIVGVLRVVEGWAMRGAATAMSVNDGVTRRVRELARHQVVQTIGNGVDTDVFSLDGVARDLGAPYLIYAGTASEVQGATVFLEAFSRVLLERPDARLVFLGHGSDWPAMMAAASRLPVGSVVFEPRRPPADAAEWLRGASASLASIAPSAGYGFAVPTKILASVACGTPVIYTGIDPGVDFAGQPGLGVSVAYEAEAISEAMLVALDAPMGATARARIADWAFAHVSLRAVAALASATIRALVR